MTKEKMCIIFLIILGLIITLFLGGSIYKEGFTISNSTVFKAVPISNPNSQQVTVSYPNNNVNTLLLNINKNTITYTLTNTSSAGPLTYTYNGSDNSKAKLTIIPNNTGPDANVKQTLVITDKAGNNKVYGSSMTFVVPSSSSNNSTSTQSLSSSTNTNIPTNFDNYNHFTGTSSTLTNEKTFYGPNGGAAIITTNSDGTQVIKVTLSTNDNPIIFTPSKFNMSGEIFYGPNGGTATIVDNNGNKAIIVKNKHGVYIYKLQDQNQYNNQNDMSSTQYFGSTGYTTYPFQSNAYTDSNSQKNNMSSTLNNMASSLSNILNPTASSSSYNSSLPQGIPGSQIPKGQESLYILKSEVVPPVCPACPAAASCPRQEKCPPCPPCGRCPEPSFECKKVPNYNAINNQYLPAPFVNSFSSFGK